MTGARMTTQRLVRTSRSPVTPAQGPRRSRSTRVGPPRRPRRPVRAGADRGALERSRPRPRRRPRRRDWSRNASQTRSRPASLGWAGRRRRASWASTPARRSAVYGRGRGEYATGVPMPRRRAFEDKDAHTGRCQPGGEDRPGRPAADDHDRRILAGSPARAVGHPPAPWGSWTPLGVGHRRRDGGDRPPLAE